MDDKIHEKLDEIKESQNQSALKLVSLENDLHSAPCEALISHRQWHVDQDKFAWDKFKFWMTLIVVIAAAILGSAATAYFMGGFDG